MELFFSETVYMSTGFVQTVVKKITAGGRVHLQSGCEGNRNIKWMVLYWLLQMLKEIEPWLSSFTCAFCNKEDAVGVVRYHVEMSVSDATNTAELVEHLTLKCVN
ncbi:hypothetical protein Bca52824_039714 [Brassica carinata]|uniref:Uncharacterized protein n=1 Tax=Brassica carinata TaxID=52824 RepID=A0A8X7RRP1_BRACI|nr:hypothetical protein Bca52824_039714 [Brassica carinata]